MLASAHIIEVTIELIGDQAEVHAGYDLLLTRRCECPGPMFAISAFVQGARPPNG